MSFSVQDPVNRYRHGVLIGNYVQDDFGVDLKEKGPANLTPHSPTTKALHNLQHTLYRPHEQIVHHPGTDSHNPYLTANASGQTATPQQKTTYSIYHGQQTIPSVPVLKGPVSRVQEKDIKRDGGVRVNNMAYTTTNITTNQDKQYAEYEKVRRELKDHYGGGGGTGNPGNNSHDLSGTNNMRRAQDTMPDSLTQVLQNGLEASMSAGFNPNATGKPVVSGNVPASGNNNPIVPKSLNPYTALSNIIAPQVAQFDEAQYSKLVLPNPKGEQRDVLFGHGVHLDDFHQKQLASTYDLSYNQKVKPQQQIDSYYQPDSTQTAKNFHKELQYQKHYQKDMPVFGATTNAMIGSQLGQTAHQRSQMSNPSHLSTNSRPYQPYTGLYDQQHMKTEYLRK